MIDLRRAVLSLWSASLAIVAAICITATSEDGAAPKINDQVVRGLVIDGAGQPVEGAIVLVGAYRDGKAKRQKLVTDRTGRFTADLSDASVVAAYKQGLAIDFYGTKMPPQASDEVILLLGRPIPFVARIQDSNGRPVPKAKVRVLTLRIPEADDRRVFSNVAEFLVDATPMDEGVMAISDETGLARIPAIPDGVECTVQVTAQGMDKFHSWSIKDRPFLRGTEEQPAVITLRPSAGDK
ncbi:MAG TPA: hypothetical protein VM165_04025 [Planctomycetaceae bacterium]|nr:hypothetical protein [Planctomycetaceae bacterium]